MRGHDIGGEKGINKKLILPVQFQWALLFINGHYVHYVSVSLYGKHYISWCALVLHQGKVCCSTPSQDEILGAFNQRNQTLWEFSLKPPFEVHRLECIQEVNTWDGHRVIRACWVHLVRKQLNSSSSRARWAEFEHRLTKNDNLGSTRVCSVALVGGRLWMETNLKP